MLNSSSAFFCSKIWKYNRNVLSLQQSKYNDDMKRTNVVEDIKQALKTIPMDLEARIYGSEARGDARPDSDIDLLILVDKPVVSGKDEDAIYAPLYQIELNTGILINPLVMPKSKWGERVTPFYVNVENEGIRL